ncbi:MAG: ATP-binding protein [Candidatus Omnitrophota bacterium]
MNAFYFNPYSLPFFFSFLFFLSLGIYVLKQSYHSQLNGSFFVICTSAAIWLFFTFVLLSSRSDLWIRRSIVGLYFGVSFISPAVYSYSVLWLGYYERQKRFILLGFLLAILFFLLIWRTPWIVSGYMEHSWGPYSLLTLYGGASYLLFFAIYMMGFFINLLRGYREAREHALVRRQIRMVAVGFVIAYLGSLDFLPCYRVEFFPIGAFTTLCLVSAIAYTIIRYKLFDIETVIHNTIMWLVTSLLGIVPIAGLLHVSQTILRSLNDLKATVVLAVLFLGFYYYFRFFYPLLNRLFRRRHSNLQQASHAFAAELVHLKDLGASLRRLARLVRRNLFTRIVTVYIRSEDGDLFVPAISKGRRAAVPLHAGQPFVAWLESHDQVAVNGVIQSNPDLREIEEEVSFFFRALAAEVVVPFVLSRKIIGFMALGRKENLRRYVSAEIRFLSDLKSPVTIAISNSLQYDKVSSLYKQVQKISGDLKELNEELEKKVLERTEAMMKMQAQLVQAEKLASLGTLAGGIAHELNNPLAAILTNAQLLKQGPGKVDLESVEIIEQGAERCKGIIGKLLNYARMPDRGKDFQPVDLCTVIRNAVSLLAYQFEQENITVDMELGEVPLIPGNPNELEQVLTNFLINARDAIKECRNEGQIRIIVQKCRDEIEMVVEDNGRGISPEHQRKIFDPFFTTKPVGRGTGLGLAVSHNILEKHGFSVQVHSEQGKGTRFHLTYPLTLQR